MNEEYQNSDLVNLLQEYNFNDLIIAAFCLLSWRDNRSIAKTALTINQALTEHDGNGIKRVETYNDLKDLYIILKKMFPVSSFDDLTINDFGEVKIKYKSEIYPILIGNGYEQTYEVMQFFIRAAKKSRKDSVLKETLQYSKWMIDSLKEYNVSNYDDSDICFDLPNESYFNAVKSYLKSFRLSDYSEEFIHCLSTERFPIEKAHFLYKGENAYPLFNASLIVDAYSYILGLMDEKETTEIVQETLWDTVHHNFNIYGSQTPKVLYPAQIANDIKKDQMYFTFIAPAGNSLIIAFNKDIFPEEILERDISRLKEYHKKGELVISEIRPRDGMNSMAIEVPKEWELHLIGYDNFTDLTEFKFQGLDNLNYTYMTALDLLLILNDIENFSELEKFIEFNNNKQYDKMITWSGTSGMYILFKGMHGLIAEGAIDFNMVSVSYDFPSRHTYDLFTKDYKNYPFELKSKMFECMHQWKVREDSFGFNIYVDKSASNFFGYGRKITENGFVFLSHNIDFVKRGEAPDGIFEQIKTIDELNQRFFERYSHLIETMQPFNNACVQFLYMPHEYACKIDRSGFTKNTDVKYVYAEYNDSYPEHIAVRYTVNIDELLKDILESKNREVENKYFLELLKPLEGLMGDGNTILHECIEKDTNKKKTVSFFQIAIDYKYNQNVSHSMPEQHSFKMARKDIAIICRTKDIASGSYRG